MENILGILLGSTVIGTMLTVISNFISGRRTDQLTRITDERKEWRNKIRQISANIEKVKWDDNERWKNRLNMQLVLLETNINPHGRGSASDFEHDAHIWSEIDSIRNVTDRTEFDSHKELLVFYLSLMLKEDWERYKREVSGYSRTLIEIVALLGWNCSAGVYYVHFTNVGTYIDTVVGVAVCTLIYYLVLRYIQSAFVGSTMKGRKLRGGYLVETIVGSWVLLMIVSVVVIAVWIYLIGCESNEQILNIVIIFSVFIEGVAVCWNWVNDAIKKFMLASYIVLNKEKILKENYQKLYEMHQIVNNLKAYIDNPQWGEDVIKVYVLQLKNILKEYDMELKRVDRRLRKTEGIINGEHYRNIQLELIRVQELKKQVDSYLREGVFYKFGRVGELLKKIWSLIKSIPNMAKDFFVHEPGKWS